MTNPHPAPTGPTRDAFPARFTEGGTYLIATPGEPARYDIDLHALCYFGTATDTAFIVTTTRSAATTRDALSSFCKKDARPALGFVDTTSERQSVSALFEGTPTIFTPAPGDLERLVLALTELTDRFPPRTNPRHLIIRSLTPLLQTTTTDRLRHVLDRVTGLSTNRGLCLLGIDYTAHDPETITELATVADGILWVSTTDDTIEIDYQPAVPGQQPRHPSATGDHA